MDATGSTHALSLSELDSFDEADKGFVRELIDNWIKAHESRDLKVWDNLHTLFTKKGGSWPEPSVDLMDSNLGLMRLPRYIQYMKHCMTMSPPQTISHHDRGSDVSVELGKKRVDKPRQAYGGPGATLKQTFTTGNKTGGQDSFTVECDVALFFYCRQDPDQNGTWKIQYVKIVFEQETLSPPTASPFSKDELAQLPETCKYLALALRNTNWRQVELINPYRSKVERFHRLEYATETWQAGKHYIQFFIPPN
ncbi:hypothetical protein G7046_g2647 [Stylonectria norvegica]|nr:hypothetical protein G7046_g2647 [Stylonectria norvegica]